MMYVCGGRAAPDSVMLSWYRRMTPFLCTGLAQDTLICVSSRPSWLTSFGGPGSVDQQAAHMVNQVQFIGTNINDTGSEIERLVYTIELRPTKRLPNCYFVKICEFCVI